MATANGSWVLSGAGVLSAAGDSPERLFSTLLQARPLARTGDDEPYPAAPLEGFDPKDYMKRKGLKYLSRTSQLTCAAG